MGLAGCTSDRIRDLDPMAPTEIGCSHLTDLRMRRVSAQQERSRRSIQKSRRKKVGSDSTRPFVGRMRGVDGSSSVGTSGTVFTFSKHRVRQLVLFVIIPSAPGRASSGLGRGLESRICNLRQRSAASDAECRLWKPWIGVRRSGRVYLQTRLLHVEAFNDLALRTLSCGESIRGMHICFSGPRS